MEVLQQAGQLGAGAVFAGPERARRAHLDHRSPLVVSGPCRDAEGIVRGQLQCRRAWLQA